MGTTFALDEELERCEAAPWAPSLSLTVKAIAALEDEPRLRLTQIIRLMVGKCVNSNEEAKLSRQAAKAIFDSVKRLDRPVMFGSRDDGDLEAISPAYFDTPRYVYEVTARFPWHRVPAVDECDVGGDVGEDPMKQRRWKNVRVDRAWVVGWLRSTLGRQDAQIVLQQAAPSRTQTKILAIFKELWPEGGGAICVKDRNRMILERWPAGEKKPSSKSFQRAFNSKQR